MLTQHTLTGCRYSQFSKFPASSPFLFCAAANKSDLRQIPWILHLALYLATPLCVLSVTRCRVYSAQRTKRCLRRSPSTGAMPWSKDMAWSRLNQSCVAAQSPVTANTCFGLAASTTSGGRYCGDCDVDGPGRHHNGDRQAENGIAEACRGISSVFRLILGWKMIGLR
jgi:hypothetical protein